jgi:hypothetical protein
MPMRFAGKLALAAAAGLGLGVAVMVAVRSADRLPPLTPERLAASRRLWESRGIASYDLDLVVSGTGLDPGTIRLEVRGGTVARAERDSIPMTGEVASYAVPGLFQSLERECELAGHPETAGAPPGYRVYLQGRFDPELGYPLRFRRVIGGANRVVEMRVARFARR